MAETPLEKAALRAPVAEIYYPALVKADTMDSYPKLVWRQPWFNPDGMHNWPVLLDVDRVPFKTWDKRVGQ